MAVQAVSAVYTLQSASLSLEKEDTVKISAQKVNIYLFKKKF